MGISATESWYSKILPAMTCCISHSRPTTCSFTIMDTHLIQVTSLYPDMLWFQRVSMTIINSHSQFAVSSCQYKWFNWMEHSHLIGNDHCVRLCNNDNWVVAAQIYLYLELLAAIQWIFITLWDGANKHVCWRGSSLLQFQCSPLVIIYHGCTKTYTLSDNLNNTQYERASVIYSH